LSRNMGFNNKKELWEEGGHSGADFEKLCNEY
jgi:hypothetical protein